MLNLQEVAGKHKNMKNMKNMFFVSQKSYDIFSENKKVEMMLLIPNTNVLPSL